MIWGREEYEWIKLVDATTDFLAERARLSRTTSHTDLNSILHQRTGVRPFDFDKDGERAAMGALLGEVAGNELPRVGALVSSIVLHLDENDAGSGFYRLAIELDRLTPSQVQTKDLGSGPTR